MDDYLYNQSLHPHFHVGLNDIIVYLRKTYGSAYLDAAFTRAAKEVYRPLIAEIRKEGLSAIERHFKRVMELECGEIAVLVTDNKLSITVRRDPAAAYMRSEGVEPDPDYIRIATGLVFDAVADETGFRHEVERVAGADLPYTHIWTKEASR